MNEPNIPILQTMCMPIQPLAFSVEGIELDFLLVGHHVNTKLAYKTTILREFLDVQPNISLQDGLIVPLGEYLKA